MGNIEKLMKDIDKLPDKDRLISEVESDLGMQALL